MREYRDARSLSERPRCPAANKSDAALETTGDVLGLHDDQRIGEPLLVPVMRSDRRLASPPTLADIRQTAALGLAWLPEPLRRLNDGTTFPVTVAPGLVALAEEFGRLCASMA